MGEKDHKHCRSSVRGKAYVVAAAVVASVVHDRRGNRMGCRSTVAGEGSSVTEQAIASSSQAHVHHVVTCSSSSSDTGM